VTLWIIIKENDKVIYNKKELNLTPDPSPQREGNNYRIISVDGSNSDYSGNLFKGATSAIFENAKELRKNTTAAESILWKSLRNRKILGSKFRRQHPIGNFVADFYCHETKLIIELDGGYHNEKEQTERDEARTQVINEFGINVIRFTNYEVINNLGTVLSKILEFFKNRK
jgi:very-short-patch-repair endonuclease